MPHRILVKPIALHREIHDPRALDFLIALLGDDRIVLGSDYPFPLGEAVPGQLIESKGELSAASRERLLTGNALAFLNRSRQDLLPG